MGITKIAVDSNSRQFATTGKLNKKCKKLNSGNISPISIFPIL